MRLPARRWFRRAHLLLGLCLGAVLVCVAGSGAALVFRDEIRAMDPLSRSNAASWDGTGDMGFARARDHARNQQPDGQLQILWFPTKARPYYEAAFFREGRKFSDNVRFHPVTGAALQIPDSPVLEWLERFHVNLHLGSFGAGLVQWSTVLFAMVLLTGLYLWWPGAKPWLWFSLRSGKLRLWDAHRVLGFLSAFPLSVMLITGLIFAFPAARAALYYLTGDTPPAAAQSNLGDLKSTAPKENSTIAYDEELLRKAQEVSPADAILFYITFPLQPDDARQVRLQVGYSPFPFGEIHRVYFDQYSGQILGHLRPDSAFASRFISRFNSELHYGTFGGLITKVLWVLACSLVPFFAVSGFLLWRRRARRLSARKPA